MPANASRESIDEIDHVSTPSDYVVIIGYFALVAGIGLWVKRSQVTASDYFAGGHHISWWMAGISHYMSGFSAFSFIVYSQMAYTYGLVAITIFWTGVPACLCGGLFFARRWRRARVITPIEFLEERCSSTVRQLFVWIGIPSKLFDDALKIFATSLFSRSRWEFRCPLRWRYACSSCLATP